MSNTDAAPAEVACGASAFGAFEGVLHPREVPLGGPRAIRVRRTLPQRDRSLIGAWVSPTIMVLTICGAPPAWTCRRIPTRVCRP